MQNYNYMYSLQLSSPAAWESLWSCDYFLLSHSSPRRIGWSSTGDKTGLLRDVHMIPVITIQGWLSLYMYMIYFTWTFIMSAFICSHYTYMYNVALCDWHLILWHHFLGIESTILVCLSKKRMPMDLSIMNHIDVIFPNVIHNIWIVDSHVHQTSHKENYCTGILCSDLNN